MFKYDSYYMAIIKSKFFKKNIKKIQTIIDKHILMRDI